MGVGAIIMGVGKLIDKGSDVGVKILKFAYVDTTKYGYRKGRGKR